MEKPDVALMALQVAMSALGFGTAAVGVMNVALKRRAKQNTKLAERLAAEVQQIKTEVEHIQALTAIHTDKLNDSNNRMAALTANIDELEQILPVIKDVMEKVLNYFERKKAGTLEEVPLPGGKVALKKKEES